MTDEKLIKQYVAHGSEDAFRQIVERYLKMVYATCQREVQNPDLAQDAAQIVFVLLAQKASRLRPGTALSGWLFTTARLTSKAALRQENRRRRYESQGAAEMPMHNTDQHHASTAATIIEPFLNDALAQLRPGDREALLLRYAEERSLREIGERYGITEKGAQMRIMRALERLRNSLKKRGIDAPDTESLSAIVPGLLVGSLLTMSASVSAASIVEAVPIVLAGIAEARVLQLLQGMHTAARLLKLKVAAIVIAGCLVAGLGIARVSHRRFPVATGTGISSTTILIGTAANSRAYTLTDIGTLQGCVTSSVGGINNNGEIVGTASGKKGDTHAFYYRDGLMTEIRTDTGQTCTASRINDHGTILGIARNPKGKWTNAVGTKDSLSIYTPPTHIEVMAFNGINNHGVIVGWYSTHDQTGKLTTTGFRLAGGKLEPISMPPGTHTIARGINNDGNVAVVVHTDGGELQSRVLSDDNVTILPNLPGYLPCTPNRINDNGDITGASMNTATAKRTAFLYHNGVIIDLGKLAGFSESEGIGMNSAGTVVGYVHRGHYSFPDYVSHAVIFKDGHAVDMNALIDPATVWELNEAIGINDSGQIVGFGLHNGLQRAFLLTPKD